MFVRSRLLDGMHSGPISIYRILRYSLAGWGLAGSIYTYIYTYIYIPVHSISGHSCKFLNYSRRCSNKQLSTSHCHLFFFFFFYCPSVLKEAIPRSPVQRQQTNGHNQSKPHRMRVNQSPKYVFFFYLQFRHGVLCSILFICQRTRAAPPPPSSRPATRAQARGAVIQTRSAGTANARGRGRGAKRA